MFDKDEDVEDFVSEAVVMRKLGSHKNIVTLVSAWKRLKELTV